MRFHILVILCKNKFGRLKLHLQVAFFTCSASSAKVLAHENLGSHGFVMVESWFCMSKKNSESMILSIYPLRSHLFNLILFFDKMWSFLVISHSPFAGESTWAQNWEENPEISTIRTWEKQSRGFDLQNLVCYIVFASFFSGFLERFCIFYCLVPVHLDNRLPFYK